MPQIKINFADIPDNLVPEGNYTAKINDIVVKEGAKAPYLNWEFVIIDEDYLDRKVWMITSLAEAALFRLKKVLESLGFAEGVDIETDDQGHIISPMLVGAEVQIRIAHNTYEGTTRAQCAEILDYFTDAHLGDPGEDDEDFEDDFEDFEDEDDFEDEEDEEDEEVQDEPEAVAPAAPAAKRKTKA